ncbi:MAG: hypothetical protein LBO63_06905 [Oscillospiraceae bacterium]|jgi:hypothetical protein|nr:hypothetical protein [Oscillospiraceae bacterium]
MKNKSKFSSFRLLLCSCLAIAIIICPQASCAVSGGTVSYFGEAVVCKKDNDFKPNISIPSIPTDNPHFA